MKVTVTKVDVQVDGDAAEIREAMPSILGADGGQAAAVTRADAGELSPASPAAPALPAGVPHHDEVIQTAADLVIDPDELATHVPDEAVPADGYEDWWEVPTSRRVWSSGGIPTLHIARDPDGLDLFCPYTVGGLARRRDWSPVPASIAKVCASCNKHIGIEARP